MTVSTSNLIGVSLGYTDTAAQFNVGTVVNLDDGGQAVYVQASSDVAQYSAVSVRFDNTVVPITTTNSANSKVVGFAQASIASAYYGWVQIGGKPIVKLAASCAPFVPLYTTATAGTLDDAVVSGGLVAGIVALTTASGATALTCVAGYPHVLTGAAG
tara:strand:+ start:51 stop:524 length:474 start_codon:yes stop_codon:yes gene_type:complete